MIPASRQTLQKHMRAAWRRAADELLIDAIFGTTGRIVRDEDHRFNAHARALPLDIVVTKSAVGLL